ncbi:MAG: hypothetical protein Q7S10_02190 [bacterium]|nr:hypothetical protein [bacterium]
MLKFLLLVVIIALLAGFWRTWKIQHDVRNSLFLKGKAAQPDGFFHGVVGKKTSWLGKKFDAQNSKGINVVSDEKNGQAEKYPFITYMGRGAADNLEVVKIDYNIKGNPWWLKLILDEIVEVAPNEYLGKMHARIIPGLPFTFLYFTLKK